MYECEFIKQLRPETLKNYRSLFRLFIQLTPNHALEDLSSQVIARFFRVLQERERMVGRGHIRKGIKRSTTDTYRKKLNKFFEWLKVNRHISENPLAHIRFATPLYEDRKFLSRQSVERILTAIITHSENGLILKRNLAIFYLLLYCGLRKEELMQLQVRDIDLVRKLLTVRAETSKTPRLRMVPLHSGLLLHLQEYLKERKTYTTPYLLVSALKDERLGTEGIQYFVERYSMKSGVRFHLHQFRHTFAVNFLKTSNNIAKLQQLLGHKNISMTLVYVRCLPPKEMRGDIEQMSIDTMI